MNILKRIKRLEDEYLIKSIQAPKFIIKFIDPKDQNKSIEKLTSDGNLYQKMPDESEEEFISRVVALSNDNLIFSCEYE